MAASLKKLVQKRASIKGKLTRLATFVENFDLEENDYDVIPLNVRLTALEECWTDFNTIQGEIEEHLSEHNESADGDEASQASEWQSFEDSYFHIHSKITRIVKSVISTSTSQPINPSKHRDTNVRLPKIDLPSFTGNYEDFVSYFELFQSLINNNESISAIQKFHYLKSSLKGEAAKLIESLEFIPDNYVVAVELLKNRYENKRIVITKHVQALFSLSKLNRESATSLRQLVDSTNKHLRALKTLKQPVEQWDTLLVHMIGTKLDDKTRRDWENEAAAKDEVPSYQEIITFLTKRCKVLEAYDFERPTSSKCPTAQPVRKWNPNFKPSGLPHNSQRTNELSRSFVSSSPGYLCVFCKKPHPCYQCDDFLKLNTEGRWNLVNKLNLCKNCLRDNHSTMNCKILKSCHLCNKRHHATLHVKSPSNNTQESPGLSKTLTNCANVSDANCVLLGTAVIKVMDNSGNFHPCRVLLDSGSQSNFMSETLCHALGLKRSPCNISVSGIQKLTTSVSHSVQTNIKSNYNLYSSSLSFLVIPKITDDMPMRKLNPARWSIPPHLFLADPNFNAPGKIDMLIGAQIFFKLISTNQIRLGDDLPVLQETLFGWIVSGNVAPTCAQSTSALSFFASAAHNISTSPNTVLEQTLEKFWEIEEVDKSKSLSPKEKLCEDIFAKTTTRQEDGRFIVHLPLIEDPKTLGESKEAAIARFIKLEHRLDKNPGLKRDYAAFLNNYLEQDHMEEVTEDVPDKPVYYLPHHPVIRDTSITTKLRVVFDASSKTTSNTSLNDILLAGPTVQRELFSIIISFRFPKYVFTTDIKQMYRQIRIHSNDCDLQRILWREFKHDPIRTYRLLTVTYGTSAAPYLATKSLVTLAQQHTNQFPHASRIVTEDCYVDDVLSGSDSLEEAAKAQLELIQLLGTAGFQLHKWVCNHPHLLINIPEEDRVQFYQVGADQQISTVKTLGLIWEPIRDSFRFQVPELPDRPFETKRTILSDISRLFDPLGLIAPVVVRAKITMQALWKSKLDWDEPLNGEILELWIPYKNELVNLKRLSVPRRITTLNSPQELELHGFCDASEQAYGACVYIRTINTGGITSNLLCAKSRVAPLKRISLPRLELCGAVLLSTLVHKVTNESNISFKQIHLWTDSSVVLSWIQSESHCWKTFISNRIAEIQRLTSCDSWHHVRSESNPADVLSRGCSPTAILENDLWWYGPPWLQLSNLPIFNGSYSELDPDIRSEESRNIQRSFVLTHDFLDNFIKNFSSYSRLIHVTSYIFRFYNNCKNPAKRTKTKSVLISSREFSETQDILITHIQNKHFHNELKTLKTNKPLSKTNHINSLHPFVDSKGMIRVGGRLANAEIPFNRKHPLLLPNYKCKFTSLLSQYCHILSLHSGPQLLLATIRLNFWPINGKILARKTVNKCVTCYKAKPKPASQLMGELPFVRVNVTRPFHNCGVDFCGPFYVKRMQQRKAAHLKIYVALFVCMSTKAIHLEITSNLTSQDFIACLKRFVARRGYPSSIYCDNATTFVGAKRELATLKSIIESQQINDYLIERSIVWKFIPARSPTFGGLWEAGVKSVKHHFKRIIGNLILNYEEFYTLTIEVEACVNSRPLIACSSNPNDPYPLTPGHFLIGEPLTAIPEPELSDLPLNHLSKWQLVQRLKQTFWKRWSQEYLSTLQARTKWVNSSPNLREGQLVLLKEDFRPPLKWEMGRIVKLHPGQDGRCRVASIKTPNGIIKRAITRLCPLPYEEDDTTSTQNKTLPHLEPEDIIDHTRDESDTSLDQP